MIGRLKGAISTGFARLFPGRRGAKKKVISGSAGNVIIVKSPNTAYFKEAIFILCDDLFTRGVNRNQILREARRAAWEYTAAHTPPRSVSPWVRLLYFLLGVLCAFALLHFLA